MSYIKCPYCYKSDGNDDVELEKEVVFMDNTECQIKVRKQCDICGKTYYVLRNFKFTYEQLEIDL